MLLLVVNCKFVIPQCISVESFSFFHNYGSSVDTYKRILDKMFTDGKIARDFPAAAVYKLDSEFSKYTLEIFRNKFNRNGLERKQLSM